MAFFMMHSQPMQKKKSQLKASYKKNVKKNNWSNKHNTEVVITIYQYNMSMVETEFLWTGYVMSAPFEGAG